MLKEPKIVSQIIVRPCYNNLGDIETPIRYIGSFYYKSVNIYTSQDYDTEDSAHQSVINWIFNNFNDFKKLKNDVEDWTN